MNAPTVFTATLIEAPETGFIPITDATLFVNASVRLAIVATLVPPRPAGAPLKVIPLMLKVTVTAAEVVHTPPKGVDADPKIETETVPAVVAHAE